MIFNYRNNTGSYKYTQNKAAYIKMHFTKQKCLQQFIFALQKCLGYKCNGMQVKSLHSDESRKKDIGEYIFIYLFLY